MHVLKSRWLALAAICLSLTLVSGCQIDSGSPNSSGGSLTHVKVSPDLNLHANPEGYVYELWILGISFEFDTIPVFQPPQPLVRFQWDPYLYVATDEDGNYLPLTSTTGMPLGRDVSDFFGEGTLTAIAMITIEPINDPTPETQNGPTLMAFNLNPQSATGVIINPYALLPFFQVPPPIATFRLLSQSNKKNTHGGQWRDNATEGYGIWFANPRLDPIITLDEATGWDAYTRNFVPADGEAYAYSVWIHRTQPESSFSNFGQVLLNREPDFDYTDGVITHPDGRFGPSEPIIRNAPLAPLPGVDLGSDPVVINGVTVGYRYIVSHPGTPTANPPVPPRVDTCIVRIDNPSLTRCNRDTFQVLQFDDVDVLAKIYRNSIGDTSMGTSLGSIIDLGDPEALGRLPNGAGFLFFGYEYEAWLVFTDASGIPPMSLGRFKSPTDFDSDNPYTYTDSRYDRNFHVPGEDFLQNLSSHHPSLSSPLNVIDDPRVEKLWITIEPDDDFGFDWAPDEPNTQLLYLSAYIPKSLDSLQAAVVPLVHRDPNPSPSGLNEGNFFPTVTVQFLPEPAE